MGRIGGAPSLKRLIMEARSGHNTAVLHVGDFAYDLNTEGGLVSKNNYRVLLRKYNFAVMLGVVSCNFSHNYLGHC